VTPSQRETVSINEGGDHKILDETFQKTSRKKATKKTQD
jgi:hypothetical protein